MTLVTLGLRALNKAGLLRHLTFNAPMAPSGRRTWVPMMKGVGFFHVQAFEPFMDTLIARLVPLFPGLFVDVGVNVGQTLIKVKSAWPEQAYVGFEPNPVCVRYAERLIAANRYAQARVVPAGLGDHDGTMPLILRHGHDAADPTASLVKDFRAAEGGEREVPVAVMTWARAEHLLPPGRLGFVKVDVEGAELDVLRTMQERLRTDRAVVSLEVLPTYDPPKPLRLERQQGIERVADACGLRLFRLHKHGREVRLQALDAFGIFSDLEQAEHMLVPQERVADVLAAFPG